MKRRQSPRQIGPRWIDGGGDPGALVSGEVFWWSSKGAGYSGNSANRREIGREMLLHEFGVHFHGAGFGAAWPAFRWGGEGMNPRYSRMCWGTLSLASGFSLTAWIYTVGFPRTPKNSGRSALQGRGRNLWWQTRRKWFWYLPMPPPRPQRALIVAVVIWLGAIGAGMAFLISYSQTCCRKVTGAAPEGIIGRRMRALPAIPAGRRWWSSCIPNAPVLGRQSRNLRG